jgi:hypothetical protein
MTCSGEFFYCSLFLVILIGCVNVCMDTAYEHAHYTALFVRYGVFIVVYRTRTYVLHQALA